MRLRVRFTCVDIDTPALDSLCAVRSVAHGTRRAPRGRAGGRGCGVAVPALVDVGAAAEGGSAAAAGVRDSGGCGFCQRGSFARAVRFCCLTAASGMGGWRRARGPDSGRGTGAAFRAAACEYPFAFGFSPVGAMAADCHERSAAARAVATGGVGKGRKLRLRGRWQQLGRAMRVRGCGLRERGTGGSGQAGLLLSEQTPDCAVRGRFTCYYGLRCLD